MNCTACGKPNPDGAMFCEQCGTSLRAQPAAGPGVAVPPPPAAAPAGVTTAQIAQQGQALIAAMSLGEKISGAGAIVAIIAFFLPWVSVTIPVLLTADTATSLSGLDLGKTIGAVYFIPLIAAVAAALCYLSSKAAPPRKLLYRRIPGVHRRAVRPGKPDGADLRFPGACYGRVWALAVFARLYRDRGGRPVDHPGFQQKGLLSRDRWRDRGVARRSSWS